MGCYDAIGLSSQPIASGRQAYAINKEWATKVSTATRQSFRIRTSNNNITIRVISRSSEVEFRTAHGCVHRHLSITRSGSKSHTYLMKSMGFRWLKLLASGVREDVHTIQQDAWRRWNCDWYSGSWLATRTYQKARRCS